MDNRVWVVVIFVLLTTGMIVGLSTSHNRFMKSSTRKWMKAGGLWRFVNLSTLHGYIYMRWQKAYIRLFINQIGPRSSQAGRQWWANQYHSKVLTEDQAKAIVTVQKNIPYQDLEQIIPYPHARQIILTASPPITVYECGCRLARKTPCTPTQVCMFIGEPFASFMHEHHPSESRILSQTEALELLQAEHERGHVHTAWFKNAMLDRFYVICNCCKCCCGGIETMVKYGIPMMASSGYVARLDEDNCAGCGICAKVCPFGALSVDVKGVIQWEKCMGCGVCVDQCPNQAISLIRDEQKGIPLNLRALVETSNHH